MDRVKVVLHRQFYTISIVAILYAIANLYLIGDVLKPADGRELQNLCQSTVNNLLSNWVPAINTPVQYLKSNDNNIRAENVLCIYSFGWISAIIAFLIEFVAVIYFYCTIVYGGKRAIIPDAANNAVKDATGDQNLGYILFSVAMIVVFFDAYIGFYKFSSWSMLYNMVQTRDRDYYRIATDMTLLILMSSIYANLFIKKLVRIQ